MNFVLNYCTTLHNRRDCRDKADNRSGVAYVDDRQRKGKNKQERSGDFIYNGMNRCQRVTEDESDHDIADLDKRDHAYPYDYPKGQLEDWQELYQYDRYKDKICYGIEPRAESGRGTRFPRDHSVKDIG